MKIKVDNLIYHNYNYSVSILNNRKSYVRSGDILHYTT